MRIEDHFQGPDLQLAQAAAAGDADAAARAIAAGADPGAVSAGGLPLIAWPILQGSAAGVRALLERGADANAHAAGAGAAIVWAAKADNPDILAAFLDHDGDPDTRAADGNPLVKVAALAGRWDNVKRLVERGAQVDAAPGGSPGDTVLHYYSAGQFDKALWLLQHGADPGHRFERAPDPERVGAQPIVENVYWWPVNAGKFPQLAELQRQSQAWLSSNGYTVPAEPAHLQRLRQRQGGADAGRDIDAEIGRKEQALKERVGP